MVFSEHRIEHLALLCVEVLEALEDLPVVDARLPSVPVDGCCRLALGSNEASNCTIARPQKPELLCVRLTEGILLQGMPVVPARQDSAGATAQHRHGCECIAEGR